MLKQRAITALIALVVLAVVLFVLPFEAAVVVIAAVILAGAWEWSGFLGASSIAVRATYVTAVALIVAALATWGGDHLRGLLFIACAWWALAFAWTFFYPTAIPVVMRWLVGFIAIVPLAFILPGLLGLGADYLLFLLLVVWAADMGAYFAGKRFGRIKLAPAISPGKTWEGVIGGFVVVALVAFAGARYFGQPAVAVVPFCLAIAAISIVGDLTVSMFKRTAGVKDSGTLFPGHGGVLDRIDSIAAAAPLYVLGLEALTGFQGFYR